MQVAVDAVARGGTIVLTGMGSVEGKLPMIQLAAKEAALLGCLRYENTVRLPGRASSCPASSGVVCRCTLPAGN